MGGMAWRGGAVKRGGRGAQELLEREDARLNGGASKYGGREWRVSE